MKTILNPTTPLAAALGANIEAIRRQHAPAPVKVPAGAGYRGPLSQLVALLRHQTR
ncbi:hypothetical protein [Hymenobacter lapidiphilus]|uniref:Uncharacterized protein n=1 Tax=Hymenobacter lapidiphilus TaxID=2608003 RepID=A0A7Y7U8F9_9BACT|nr:hypothetical protein [Hymenobacter lapidiphilus]NVO33540.1 hypothetical protein [Hymenobacter lapidiphilus]